MTAQLSPEQVRSLLAGGPSPTYEQESMTAGGPKGVYRVTWDRCAVCKERLQGLSGVRAPGPHPRIMYVCEWCRKELGINDDDVQEHDGAHERSQEQRVGTLFDL